MPKAVVRSETREHWRGLKESVDIKETTRPAPDVILHKGTVRKGSHSRR